MTGGSAGLGLALAVLLAKRGADVSIVARNEGRLRKALAEMEVNSATGLLSSVIYPRDVIGSSPNAQPGVAVVLLLIE